MLLLLLLPVCVSLILFPVLGEDEDIGERRFFLPVLAITIKKQTEILREKTSAGVLVIQLCQKSPRYRGDIALNRAKIAEWFTRAILMLQLLGDKKATNYAACIIRFMLDEKGSLLRISGWRRTMGFIGYIRFLYKGVSLKRGPLFAPSHLSVNVAARSCQKI